MFCLPSIELTHLQISSPRALPNSHTGERWQFIDISLPYYLFLTRPLSALTCPDALCNKNVLATKMANRCTDSEGFYRRLEELKSKSKNKSNPVDIYIDDSFYQKAYQWLKAKAQNEGNSITIDRKDKCQIIEKQWKATADDCKILDEQNRYVVPKKEIFTALANCHSAIAHRGRHKTEDYVKKRYSGITQKVVNLFISMCTLHLQQKSVTDHQTNSNRWLHEPCAN